MKKTVVFLSILNSSLNIFAQDAITTKSFWDDPVNSPMLSVYLVFSLLIVVILLVAIVGFNVIKVLNLLTIEETKKRAAKLGIAYVPRLRWWTKFAQKINNSVPIEQEKQIELDHNYDGIKELDNHLPPWWKWLFYGTIGWAAIYLIVFHVFNSLPLSIDEYQNEVVSAEEQIRKLKASQPQSVIDESALAFTDDQAIVQNGKSVFMSNNCGSCHRNDGGGNAIGPNLTDEYWIHGGGIKNVFTTIKNGVVEKGMPSWGKVMSPQDVRDVAFFIISLQGSKPANAKGPQGLIYKAGITEVDSAKVQGSL